MQSRLLRRIMYWWSILVPILYVIWFLVPFSIENTSSPLTIVWNDWLALVVGCCILAVLIYQIFFVLIVEDSRLTDRRILWVALLLFGNVIVMPFFAFYYLRDTDS